MHSFTWPTGHDHAVNLCKFHVSRDAGSNFVLIKAQVNLSLICALCVVAQKSCYEIVFKIYAFVLSYLAMIQLCYSIYFYDFIYYLFFVKKKIPVCSNCKDVMLSVTFTIFKLIFVLLNFNFNIWNGYVKKTTWSQHISF